MILSGEIVRVTDKAILFNDDSGTEVWIPKSLIDEDEFSVGSADIEVESWFCEKNGLA